MKTITIDGIEYNLTPKVPLKKGDFVVIQDAKDGDVISFNDGHGNDSIELIKSITEKEIEFGFCITNGNYYKVFDGIIPYTNLVSREDATPATKEQCDLLFQKMKEAGYEWDAEKKELKKIKQNQVLDNALKIAFDKSRKDYPIEDKKDAIEYSDSILPTSVVYGESEEEFMLHTIMEAAFIAGQNTNQNPSWSEEDEVMIKVFDSILRYIAEVIDKDVLERFGTEHEELFSWLKSLKDRVQPKQE